MTHATTPLLSMQDFFTTTLNGNVAIGDTVINLNAVPTSTEGYLVIDPNNTSTREIIYYNSKTSGSVTCPDATQSSSRGIGGTTVQAHTSGTLVEMRSVAEYYTALQNGSSWAVGSIGQAAFTDGWAPGLATPNTVTALGNRSYSLVFNGTDLTSTLSAGMRLKTTRTVAAPNQCTSLNGTTQFYNRASGSVAGMTFTNNFVVSAWVKLTAYNATSQSIASRYNGTSGWDFGINGSGQPYLIGYNAASANQSNVTAVQSIPLNKWVHVAAQLDMLTFTATTTTSYVMIDGVDVPATVTRAGTNPTALVQAGNLEIGSRNAGVGPFTGKIAQVAIYNAKVTEATILASMHQTLAGTETSLISAYGFNGVLTDLNANANTLTANGSAVATNADSPFGGQADGTISTTKDYGIITKTAFSTNTTLTVQVPEGCTIPTSGGVTSLAYSTAAKPYLMPTQKSKWTLYTPLMTSQGTTSNATFGSFISGGYAINVPIGSWNVGMVGYGFNSSTTQVFFNMSSTTSITGTTSTAGFLLSPLQFSIQSSAAAAYFAGATVSQQVDLAAATSYVVYTVGATTGASLQGNANQNYLFAECAYL